MNNLNIPVAYNSGTSSDTSETPSIENKPGSVTPILQNSESKIPKIWKRMKESNNDGESKRPPWRAVSISTLPKPDKSALWRAKVLDATRRLRKLTVGIQTDIVPTKLMKEVGLGDQTDLVLRREVGILTDGLYAKRSDGTEQYVLTYSVGQMTDAIETVTVSTQTLIPRLPGDAFLEAHTSHRPSSDNKLLHQCSKTEKHILKQLTKLRNSAIPLTAHFAEENLFELPADTYSSEPKTSTEIKPKDTLHFNVYLPKLLYPTQLSWHFEYDMDLIQKSNSISPYTITAHKPWNSFIPLSCSQFQHIDLNFLLQSIDELISESNRLADFIENMMKQRKPATGITLVSEDPNKSKNSVATFHRPPSDYWLPIIEEQEERLAKLQSFKKNIKINPETKLN